MNKISSAITITLGLFAGSACAAELMALGEDGRLYSIDTDRLKVTSTTQVSSDSPLRGIDLRPATGEVYALTEDNQLLVLNTADGSLTAKSKLSQALPGNGQAVVDFNPVADRLRLLAADGTNFRVNVDSGEVTLDGKVAYAQDGAHADQTPAIMAGAYTNSHSGAESTALYNIDLSTGQLMLQNPPNDGVQQAVGMITDDLSQVAFDIASDGEGGNTAWLLTGNVLHQLNLGDGSPSTLGAVDGLPENILDLVVRP